MYKPIAMFAGALVALMILSNSFIVSAFGNESAVFVSHTVGLVTALIFFALTGSRWQSLKGIPIFYLLAGITGLATVYLSNLSFMALGATLTLVLSMFGQIVTSSVIDHFGLMGMRRYPFKTLKILGLLLMALGVFFIVFG